MYSFWLAERGYSVHLIDIVPRHVEEARQSSAALSLASISLGDARTLNFADGDAQAVLLLGPLYHLTERSDRLQALREARRVLAHAGMVFVAAISRFASALNGLLTGFLRDPAFRSIVKQDLADGQHRNPTDNPAYFTTTFFHHPDELKSEMEEAGFVVSHLLVVEGVGCVLHDLTEQWNDAARRECLLDTIRWMEGDPSVLGVTSHLLAVGRKKE